MPNFTGENIMFRALLNRAGVALLVFGLFTGAGTLAQAGEPCCHYKQIVEYFPQQVAYPVQVVRYTDCGKPYYVTVVKYRTIQVAVTRTVKVCY
jgi:hypothetical protein